MSLGDTAPLVPITHDWASPVERVRTFPTAVLPANEDGTEQRLGLSHVPTDVLTYRLLLPKRRDAAVLKTLPDLATDTIVRIPRWEDQTRVDPLGVSAGAAAVIPCNTTDKPTFLVGLQVILVRREPTLQYEVTTIDAVAADSMTADLTAGWAAGTIVAPISAVRLTLPLQLTHWVPAMGALTCQVSTNIADIAGVGAGGTKAPGVPASIVVGDTFIRPTGRSPIFARVTDAAGNELPGDGIVWSSSDPTNFPIYATPDPRVAIVANPNSLLFPFWPTITATLGALSDTGTALT